MKKLTKEQLKKLAYAFYIHCDNWDSDRFGGCRMTFEDFKQYVYSYEQQTKENILITIYYVRESELMEKYEIVINKDTPNNATISIFEYDNYFMKNNVKYKISRGVEIKNNDQILIY